MEDIVSCYGRASFELGVIYCDACEVGNDEGGVLKEGVDGLSDGGFEGILNLFYDVRD